MTKPKSSSLSHSDSAPMLNPEAYEKRLISKAYRLVDQRLTDGTASSQETTHFLKLGSEKEKLEREKLSEENKLLRAKTETLESQKQSEELFKDAIKAFRGYSGQDEEDAEEDY